MDRIGKVGDRVVYADPESVDFAKAYIAGHRADSTPGDREPTARSLKDKDAWMARYSVTQVIRHGFAGSGEWVFVDGDTGARYNVWAVPNGRGFYGTDVRISRSVAGGA